MNAALVPDWIDHSPDVRAGMMACGRTPPRVPSRELRAEVDCPCGICERHTHCEVCGRVVSIGDWDAKPIREWTMSLRTDKRPVVDRVARKLAKEQRYSVRVARGMVQS